MNGYRDRVRQRQRRVAEMVNRAERIAIPRFQKAPGEPSGAAAERASSGNDRQTRSMGDTSREGSDGKPR